MDPVNVRNLVAGFVGDGVVQNDDSVLRPPCFIALFVPVVLIEELVERALTLRLKNAFRDVLDSLIAGGNKARHVGFVWYFC